MSHVTFWTVASASVAAVICCSVGTSRASDGEQRELATKVRSIFSNRCFACHGPDPAERQGGFRLDEHASFTSPADSGLTPIQPGNAEGSELLRRITSDEEWERMPPADFGQPLGDADVQLIRQWIESGGGLAGHWSFVPPQRPAVPAAIDLRESFDELSRHTQRIASWLEQPIDRFVLAEQLKRELTPSPRADRRELLRRLSLDLTGLPPSLEELRSFEQDSSPDALENQVDRLLASPAFGEHWGRKWLDLARYADSAGYADDPSRIIWAYRDWVINALNANKPIDQFTIEQLAGDLLPDPTTKQLVATAFHRNTMTNNEGGTNDEEFRNVAVVDRVNTTFSVWMGLTMGCAQCHTHKYDPITQEEYFQLFAIFNQSQDADRRDESPVLELFTDEQRRQRRQLQRRRDELRRKLDGLSETADAEFATWMETLRPTEWRRLPIVEATSQADQRMQVTEDNLLRVVALDGEPDNDLYTLRIELPASQEPIRALALKTWPLDALPNRGAGMGNGNFVVTDVVGRWRTQSATDSESDPAGQVATSDTQEQWRRLTFVSAHADYHQPDSPPAAAIDGKSETGWAVGGEVPAAHRLTLLLESPLEVSETTQLELRIAHQSPHKRHNLASFGIEATHSPHAADWARLSSEFRELFTVEANGRDQEGLAELQRFFSEELSPTTAPVRRELQQVALRLDSLQPYTTVPIMRERAPDQRRQTHLQIRGNYRALGKRVVPGTPSALHPLTMPQSSRVTSQSTGSAASTERLVATGRTGSSAGDSESPRASAPDRLDLARWLVDRNNPLTARVWVNRMWQTLFGNGLVRTVGDFGAQGELPSHPELLDWLAVDFMESGWDNKRLLRMLVLSETYLQSSRVTAEDLRRDQNNIWLARGPRLRLSAEMVRDQALLFSGLLDRQFGGAPVRPPQPRMGLKAAFGSQTDWEASLGGDRYRRGLYTQWRRSNPYPSMATFDAPSREVCILQREQTNTPLQALVTLNDPAFVEAAQALARRVVIFDEEIIQALIDRRDAADSASDVSDRRRLAYAFELTTSRRPTEREIELLHGLLLESRRRFDDDRQAAEQLATDPIGPIPEWASVEELAAWTTVANVLLNLDEVMMKR